MQFTVAIQQAKAVEWDLNLSQAFLFSFLYELPSWATGREIDGCVYYWISKEKVIEELPLLTDKPDTIKRLQAALEKKGLIQRKVLNNKVYICVTEKGKTWNKHDDPKVGKKIPPRENNPDQVGKIIPPKAGKKSPLGREKNPAYQYTNNQHTSDQCISAGEPAAEKTSAPKPEKKKSSKKPELDFSKWPSEPDEQIFADWKTMRTAKKAPVTQTVLNRMATELGKAAQGGYTVDQCLELCCERGWQGFQFQWLLNTQAALPLPGRLQSCNQTSQQRVSGSLEHVDYGETNIDNLDWMN